jgi:uncharacterized protein (DUF1778 family)
MKPAAHTTARLEARLPHEVHALLKRAAQIHDRKPGTEHEFRSSRLSA